MKGSERASVPGGEEPVFNEPWEANAFALVLAMHDRGHFTWSEWAQVLGKTIANQDADMPYYASWLVALENLVLKQSILESSDVDKRKDQWKAALRATPHGKPIELGNLVGNQLAESSGSGG